VISAPRGREIWNAVLNDDVVRRIRELQSQGMGPAAVSRNVGFALETVRSVMRRRSWTHVL
jgi:hypothetical protein